MSINESYNYNINNITNCYEYNELMFKYPDFLITKSGPSVIFGFLFEINSSRCFNPKCPDKVSLYFKALLESNEIDYYGLNWLINNIINYLSDSKTLNNSPLKNEFTYFSSNELKEIINNLIGINSLIFEEFKNDQITKWEDIHSNESSDYEEFNYEYNTLHEIYFKYLYKLIDQISKTYSGDIPKDYEIHSILFTGNEVKASGNVGIDIKTENINQLINNEVKKPADNGKTDPIDTNKTDPIDNGNKDPIDTNKNDPIDNGKKDSIDTNKNDPIDTNKIYLIDTNKKELEEKKKIIENEINKLENELNKLENEFGNNKLEINELEKTIKEIKIEYENSKLEIEKLEREIEKLETELKNYKNEIKNK